MNKELHRKTYAEVHVANLKHNTREIRKVVQSSFFCPMVKSNAYGHGDYEVVKALIEEGVDTFGVALVEEALRLRGYGFKDINILVFGSFKSSVMDTLVENQITPVISQWKELKELSERDIKDYPVHIKFNTGMNRFGFEPNEAGQLQTFFQQHKKLKLDGLATHFACGEDFGILSGFSEVQQRKFLSLKSYFPDVLFHSFNSPALFGALDKGATQNDMGARPGLALYGSYPLVLQPRQKLTEKVQLKPVMTLKSEVVAYHDLKVGDRVSYGGTWQAQKPSVIGTVPIGYTDGYSRGFSNKGIVLYRGQIAPVVGKVCMDYMMIDLTEVVQGKKGLVGEEVILFGKDLSLEILSEKASKIPYELMTTVGRRVPRQYIY